MVPSITMVVFVGRRRGDRVKARILKADAHKKVTARWYISNDGESGSRWMQLLGSHVSKPHLPMSISCLRTKKVLRSRRAEA